MRTLGFALICLTTFGVVATEPPPAAKPPIRMLPRAADPHGAPRPADGSKHVPLRTSLYFELGAPLEKPDDQILADSIEVRLLPEGGPPLDVLRAQKRFAPGASGWLKRKRLGGVDVTKAPVDGLAVYIDPGVALRPSTTYTVHVDARSRDGAVLPEKTGGWVPAPAGTWRFTTEAAATTNPVNVAMDLASPPIQWHGRFFSGLCNVTFCSRIASIGDTYEMMDKARKLHPRAWNFQRDFWFGNEDRVPEYGISTLPNIVRERETRRITAMDQHSKGVLVHVEDFFGHEQYGIPSGRPLTADYHAGDEILIADGVSDARAKVLAADDKAGTVLVTSFKKPAADWRIAYDAPVPDREDPEAPGMFPPGGCYLRKFSPHGTPCYYWGRLDKEFDLVHKRYGRKLLPNFCDPASDLTVDGRGWTTAKDLTEWHEVVRTITGHLIDRYGDDALSFTWSIFNEPDLGAVFWRSDWNELQRFYDYSTDAILRAFEDHKLDSDKVFIGGFELGSIFGTHLQVTEVLAHCSPTATAKGALPLNAAFADPGLEGKRSRRVETLCRAHKGKGSPCDFVSIHAYNKSETMAAKLVKAKEMALQIDPAYYRNLWVDSHEACPDWMPPPDVAAADSYLGNGYFSTWCADVVARQLGQAARDSRYAYGETILTVWPPMTGFGGLNTISRHLPCDDDGDGRSDRIVTVPNQVFHVLTLISDLGDRYWVPPLQSVGGHTVGAFASRDDKNVTRIVLYTHSAQDTQCRSDAQFNVALTLDHPGFAGPAQVQEFRFDRDHNSYFRLGRALRDRPRADISDKSDRADAIVRGLESNDPKVQLESLQKVETLSAEDEFATFSAVVSLAEKTKDDAIRKAAHDVIRRVFIPALHRQRAFSRAEVEEVSKLAECCPTGSSTLPARRSGDEPLHVKVSVAGNGLNILVIQPDAH